MSDEPLGWSWPTLRRGLVRGALFGGVAALVTLRPTAVVCAWIPLALSLFDARARARASTTAREVLVFVAAFLLVSVALVASLFQAIYLEALLDSGSVPAALARAKADLDLLLRVRDGPPAIVFVLYVAHAAALGLVLQREPRGRPRRAAVLAFVAIVLIVPALEWAVVALLAPDSWRTNWLLATLSSSGFLAIGGVVADSAFTILDAIAVVFDRSLEAR